MCKLDNLPVRLFRGQDSRDLVEDGKDKPVYCTCRGIDNGSYMIACDVCEKWLHGSCVGDTEEEGEEIDLYTCPACRACLV
ncbi:hypothetical protein DPMN_164443 [Dreissena polymorpha]|uniref:PHD-type domain-containing protein n=1 Tax=Dreissena polymorpha TaxID=45954 RepID=A0A9D4ISC6_DREPO|nr:hypothetical protein DPMN_164443 [Dreissena polymorpha]